MNQCPGCDAADHPLGANYCYVCGTTLREGGKPHSGEPIFVLYGRDPMAPALVRLWAAQQWQEHGDPASIAEARQCADAMESWRKEREREMTDGSLLRERLKQVVDGHARPTARENLILAVDFIARIVNHSSKLSEKDASEIGILFVEGLDHYVTDRLRANRDDRQREVFQWAKRTFGPVAMSIEERVMRFFEEAVELAQAEGLSRDRLVAIVDHVYRKPPGDPAKEAGAVGVTLLAYCERRGLSADAEERREFDRIDRIEPDYFRARQGIKAAAGITAAGEEPGQ